MELKNNKSALAALATLGVTAVAATATAIVKINKNRRQRRLEHEREESDSRLSAEQRMVYNEAVSAFVRLNDRIYALRRHREQLQAVISRLVLKSEKPLAATDDEELSRLSHDVERFLSTQVPFINACLASIDGDVATYADAVHAPLGAAFDSTLDEEPTGLDVAEGAPVQLVLKAGYYFPESTIAPHPVKAIVLA